MKLRIAVCLFVLGSGLIGCGDLTNAEVIRLTEERFAGINYCTAAEECRNIDTVCGDFAYNAKEQKRAEDFAAFCEANFGPRPVIFEELSAPVAPTVQTSAFECLERMCTEVLATPSISL